jgi:alpha-ribazole phosphatase
VKHKTLIHPPRPCQPTSASSAGEADLWCWRHPKARGAAGRCIGRTDLPVDPRKAKRLAHRIRRQARQHALPAVVWTSPLHRARAVGAWLRRWGWRWHMDARLAELDFGRWDGLPWTQVPWAEVEAWQADLLHHAPGGGESLQALAERVRSFTASLPGGPVQLVSHGGWINALLHVPPGLQRLLAQGWPTPPRHGSLTRALRPRC